MSLDSAAEANAIRSGRAEFLGVRLLVRQEAKAWLRESGEVDREEPLRPGARARRAS